MKSNSTSSINYCLLNNVTFKLEADKTSVRRCTLQQLFNLGMKRMEDGSLSRLAHLNTVAVNSYNELNELDKGTLDFIGEGSDAGDAEKLAEATHRLEAVKEVIALMKEKIEQEEVTKEMRTKLAGLQSALASARLNQESQRSPEQLEREIEKLSHKLENGVVTSTNANAVELDSEPADQAQAKDSSESASS